MHTFAHQRAHAYNPHTHQQAVEDSQVEGGCATGRVTEGHVRLVDRQRPAHVLRWLSHDEHLVQPDLRADREGGKGRVCEA